jgi:hypothetical protein
VSAPTGPVPDDHTPDDHIPDDHTAREALAARVSAAVLAFPGVAGPHGGPYNDIATFRPGGRLIGVRIDGGAEPVAVGVVLGADRPIPEVVRGLRELVSRLCGGAAVDITVGDLAVDPALAELLQPAPTAPVAAVPGRSADPGRMVR